MPTSPSAKVQSGNPYFFGKLHAHRTFATAFVLWLVQNSFLFKSFLLIFLLNRFDTFFHPSGQQYSPNVACKVHTGEGDWEQGDVLKLRPSLKRKKTSERMVEEEKKKARSSKSTTMETPPETKPNPETITVVVVGSSPLTTDDPLEIESREESFTTGPHGIPTHWKQTVFLLKTPIEIQNGRCPSAPLFDWRVG